MPTKIKMTQLINWQEARDDDLKQLREQWPDDVKAQAELREICWRELPKGDKEIAPIRDKIIDRHPDLLKRLGFYKWNKDAFTFTNNDVLDQYDQFFRAVARPALAAVIWQTSIKQGVHHQELLHERVVASDGHDTDASREWRGTTGVIANLVGIGNVDDVNIGGTEEIVVSASAVLRAKKKSDEKVQRALLDGDTEHNEISAEDRQGSD